jgi:putative oxidoreductase
MWKKLLATSNSLPLAILRVTLGIVMFPHGAQKMLGWFGGQGFAATMGGFEHQGIPAVFACLAILAEFLGGLGLIFGLLSRIAAFGILCNMVVAVLRVHASNGLFMNWTGTHKGEGFEYHLLAIAMAIVVMAAGAGAWSLDRRLARK